MLHGWYLALRFLPNLEHFKIVNNYYRKEEEELDAISLEYFFLFSFLHFFSVKLLYFACSPQYCSTVLVFNEHGTAQVVEVGSNSWSSF